ncbi:MAG: glycosyl transferase [Pirellulaceae bacterium]|nr:MAG: glycosyl transferase [Pirellulaceae bacterium]
MNGRWTSRAALMGLTSLQAICLLAVAWGTGPGWDEWGHLPSGLYQLQYGDPTPYCVNPPLTRLIGAAPVWLAGGGIDYEPLPRSPGFRPEGPLGWLYIVQHGERAFTWMSVARTAVIPIALFGTYLIWMVGTRLFDERTGRIAAALWAFSPTVLTFGASITPDATAAVFGLLAAWRFYVWLRIGTINTAWWLGIATGLAMLSKATWLILPPMMALMTIGYGVICPRRWQWSQRWKQGAGIAAVCWVVIHAAYEFQGTLVPLEKFEFVSDLLRGDDSSASQSSSSGNRFRGTWLGRLPSPLPAAYLRGIDIQKSDFEGRMQSYFFGQWRDGGWWYYYLVGLWLKEPVALWLMVVIGLIEWGKQRFRLGNRTRLVARGIVLTPGIALLAFVSSQTGFNHHLRYVLPFLPCFYLLIAAGVASLRGRRRYLIIALVVWYAASSLSVLPRSYAYFTEAIGGPSQGWKYLENSNLDWGQDILTVKAWVEANPDKRPIFFVYSIPIIDFHKLGIDAEHGGPATSPQGPTQPGWWVVCASPMMRPENRWFREHEPTERLSVTTSVYYISPEVAQRNREASVNESLTRTTQSGS